MVKRRIESRKNDDVFSPVIDLILMAAITVLMADLELARS